MSSNQRIIIGVFELADRMRGQLEKGLAPYDITLQQFNVLRILRGALPEGLPVLTIAERMVERCPGITRMLERIVDKGLIDRKRCTKDRRVVYCFINTAGLKLLEDTDPVVVGCEETSLVGLNNIQKNTMLQLLQQLSGVHGDSS